MSGERLVGKRLALLGGGNMTEALVCGLLKATRVRAADLVATDLRPERRQLLQETYKIGVSADNAAAAKEAHIVILSVEPQVLDQVLGEVAPVVSPATLIVSVAAGYPIARVQARVPRGVRVIRAMPNTPSSIGAGVTAISLGPGVSDDERELARQLFDSVGTTVVVDERLMDAVTGLSGSGPAYIYVMIEALADGGVKMGLPRAVAELLAAQTVLGAARMLLETGEPPGRLKDRVASPGGTTIAGLHALEAGRLRATLIEAVEASARRSQELTKELGPEPS